MFLIASLHAFSACTNRQAHTHPLNVILISIDTLRADRLGCYGYERPTTPIIDWLAADGVLFEDCTATSPWTLPSHASMLTGLYPARHGLKSFENTKAVKLPDQCATLAETLRDRGYSTAAIVNSHYLNPRYGLHRGFSDFTYIKESFDRREPSKVGEKAKEWLTNHEKPFFLFLHYYDVHSDYASLPVYEEQFVHQYSGPIDGSTEQLAKLIDGGNPRKSLNHDDVQHLIDLYDASVRQIDNEIGKLTEILTETGLIDTTLLVITSDHGEEFLEHGSVLHGKTQFQELIQVPLIMKGTGLPSGIRVKEMTSLVDLVPTILKTLGIRPTDNYDGVELCSLWENYGRTSFERFLFSEANQVGEQYAVRLPRYKLILDEPKMRTYLFDLASDHREQRDISSEHIDLVETLLAQVRDYMRLTSAAEPISSLTQKEVEALKSLGYAQ